MATPPQPSIYDMVAIAGVVVGIIMAFFGPYLKSLKDSTTFRAAKEVNDKNLNDRINDIKDVLEKIDGRISKMETEINGRMSRLETEIDSLREEFVKYQIERLKERIAEESRRRGGDTVGPPFG